ncbi:MAG: helix-turn-helix domain-containing protein [Candidatus Paceibacterota bacterium]
MPHVSSKKLKKETLNKLNKKLLSTFGQASEDNDLYPLFQELFTYTEKIMLSKRLAIILLLSKEIPQHRIVDILRVSPSTVAKTSLNIENGKYNIILKIANKKQKGVLDLIEFLLTAGGTLHPKAGRGRWKKIFKDFE